MKEITLKYYFENIVSVEDLAKDLKGSQQKTGFDTKNVFIEKFEDNGEYEITRKHLIRLCDDAMSGHIKADDLNTIAFALSTSEYFTWPNVNPEDLEIIENTLFDWDNPGIGFPITVRNLQQWKVYLESGVYNLDPKSLRGSKKINEA
jgi:hypothetical protein